MSRWSSVELAAQAVAEGLVVAVSASTVRRWLHEDAIKAWQHRSWILPRDPDSPSRPPGCSISTSGRGVAPRSVTTST